MIEPIPLSKKGGLRECFEEEGSGTALSEKMITKRLLLCFMILMFCCPVAGFPSAPPDGGVLQQYDGQQVVQVRLEKLIHEIVRRNTSVIGDYLQAKMSKERIRGEEGVFEPVFQTSLNKQKNHVPNSTEDILTRQQSEYSEDVTSLELGINGTISSTGATWDLKFSDRQRNSSTIEQFRDYKFEYDNLLKLSLGQPLLKGFGSDVTRAKIEMAKVQSDIDDSKYDQKMMELVAVTIQLYWKLYGVQQIHQTWERSLKIAEDTMRDMELRNVGGKIPQTDLMEAQSLISTTRAELHNAKSKVFEVQSQLMTLMNVAVFDYRNMNLTAVDIPFGTYPEITDSDGYVRMALERWPEYRIAKKSVEKERIQLKYVENQLLPQLDLIGSVSLNSLDQEHQKAFREVTEDKFVSWSTGIKFSVPFLDNAQAKSGFTIARMRAKQADIELASLEKSLANSIYSKVSAMISLREQLLEYEKGLKIREQLLGIEQIKLKQGNISLKNLLDKEEEYVNYQRKVLNSMVNYKLAEATLEIAVGTILEKYKVDPTDIRRDDRFSHRETILTEPLRLQRENLEGEAPADTVRVR